MWKRMKIQSYSTDPIESGLCDFNADQTEPKFDLD